MTNILLIENSETNKFFVCKFWSPFFFFQKYLVLSVNNNILNTGQAIKPRFQVKELHKFVFARVPEIVFGIPLSVKV